MNHWDPGLGVEGTPEGTKLGATSATSYPDDKSFSIPLSLSHLIYKTGMAMLPFMFISSKLVCDAPFTVLFFVTL